MKDCSAIKVGLALYRNTRTGAPTTYRLARVYVASSPQGSRLELDGTWDVAQGTALDRNAAVYRLDAGAPNEFRLYWAIGRDLLFLLDDNLQPRVGTASWSCVLNRTR